LPVWGRFFQKVYADSTIGIDLLKRFEKPENMTIELDCDKYQAAAGYSADDYGEEFDKPTTNVVKDTVKNMKPTDNKPAVSADKKAASTPAPAKTPVATAKKPVATEVKKATIQKEATSNKKPIKGK